MLVPFFLISLLLFCPSAPIDIASIMRRANKIAISYNFRDNCISRKRPFNRKTINYVSKCLSEYDFNYTEDDTLLINLNFDIILNRPDINAFSSLDTLSLFTKKEANIVLVSKEEKHMDAIESSFYYAIKNNWFESFKILHSIYGDKSSAPINNVLRIVLKKGRVASASLWVYELKWNPWEQFTITIKQFHDRLGLVRAVVERSDYYAYGTRISQPYSGASAYPQLSANRWRFSGKEEQDAVASSPTLDFGARQYDPFIARWLSQDPLAEKFYAHSPYLFCAGNPVRFVDPEGMNWYRAENGTYEYYEGQLSNEEMIARSYTNDMGYSFVENNKYYGLFGNVQEYNKLGKLYEKIDLSLIRYANYLKKTRLH